MKNLSERGLFEDQLQGMFEDAEATPSTDLWTRLDADLANDKADQYRKRVFVYQWVAAASLFLALSFAAVSFFYSNTNSTQNLASNDSDNGLENSIGNDTGNDLSSLTPEGNSGGADGSASNLNEIHDNQLLAIDDRDDEEALNELKPLPLAEESLEENTDELKSLVEHSLLVAANNDIHTQQKQPFQLLNGVHRPMYKHINRRPTLKDLAIIPRKEKATENFWAGVNFSSGMFDPGVSESSSSISSASLANGAFNRDATNVIPAGASYKTLSFESANYSANKQEESISPGFSYTAGINTGFRLGKRWTIETGVSYVKNTNQSETSTIIETREDNMVPLTMANYGEQSYNLGRLKYSYDDIQLNNSYEFVSVPIKAAYWLLQSNLSVALSAGVSTNLFLQNNVADNAANLDDITVKPGEASPYRNVYFNGVLSTQITYQFPGAPYSLMLEPSYLLALNNMTKDEFYFNSRPRSFMLGVGLRYHFN